MFFYQLWPVYLPTNSLSTSTCCFTILPKRPYLQTNQDFNTFNFYSQIIASKCESLKKEKIESNASHCELIPIMWKPPYQNPYNYNWYIIYVTSAYKQSWKTFLELLIESPGGYGNVELREETLVIVLAGTDTSAVGTAFTTVMLAKYPNIQEKVYQE